MKDAKAAMDALENKVRLELQGERDATLELIEEKITDLKRRSEFQSLGNLEKEQVVKPLLDQKKQAKQERFIGNLRNQRMDLGNVLTNQLNMLMDLAAKKEDGSPNQKPKKQFFRLSKLHPDYHQKELESEEEVDEYLKSLRDAMMEQIQKNRTIRLD